MPALLGVNPLRPPPAEKRRIAVDYHRWHLDMVEAESLEQAAKLEEARGVCALVVPTRHRARRAGAGDRPTVPRRQRDMSDPLERGKALLVSARAATWAGT